MSEIDNTYKRSMGMTYDERALEVELSGGASGYDIIPEEIVYDDLSINVTGTGDGERVYLLALVEQEVDRAELELEYAKERFEAVVADEAVAANVDMIAAYISADYDQRRSQGQPVGQEFYQEARDIAEALTTTNPEFDAAELSRAAEVLVQLQFAERKLVRAEQELQYALAA